MPTESVLVPPKASSPGCQCHPADHRAMGQRMHETWLRPWAVGPRKGGREATDGLEGKAVAQGSLGAQGEERPSRGDVPLREGGPAHAGTAASGLGSCGAGERWLGGRGYGHDDGEVGADMFLSMSAMT